MKDIQKIKEFFSKPLNEATFKVGDKVTYLGHPGVITAVNKEMTGDITYNVSYDKGTGKTKATNLFNKDGEIKMAEAITTAYEAKTVELNNKQKKYLKSILNNRYGKGAELGFIDNGVEEFIQRVKLDLSKEDFQDLLNQDILKIRTKPDKKKPYKALFLSKDLTKMNLDEAVTEYFKPSIRKDKSNPNFLYVDIAYPAGSDVLSIGGSKTMGGQDREAGAAKALAMGNAVAKKLQAKYNIEDIDVSDLKNGKVEVFAVSDDFIKMSTPSLDEAKSGYNTNDSEGELSYEVMWTDRDYKKHYKVFKNDPNGPPDNAKKKAEAFIKSLEDKDKKSKEGLYRSIDLNEAKEETAIDMAKKQLDALGVKYEMSKTDKVRPFKIIYKPINKEDDWYDKFEEIVDLFNLKGFVKQSMSEASSTEKFLRKLGWAGEDWTPQEFASQIKKLPDSTLISWAKSNKGIGKGISNTPLAFQQKLVKIEMDKRGLSLTEAKSEDKVDTITMDIPLFLRMLEYSREDAEQDLDLHDVTEKAISLGKERGILQMDDYAEIVGTTEEIQEIEDDRFKNDPWKGGPEYKKEDLLAQKIFGIKYFNWLSNWEQFHLVNKYNLDKNIITKEGMGGQLDEPYFIEVSVRDARKALDLFNDQYSKSNIKMYGSNVYAANTPEDIYDLYYDLDSQNIEVLDYNVDGDLDEATDYMKRRKAMDDYAVSKKDKPAKPYNPNPSGKTDYMKRREKDLEEKITEALDKINEELCPAGKAYIKRRKAAGEKSSAYLSGRAVKVCKGQMSGKAKKK